MQCWLAVGQYPVGKRAADGQHAVCAWTARGQHTACAWSAHGQHAVTLWPACDRSRAHSFTNIILLVMGQSQNPPNRKYDGVHFFYNRIYHTKVTSEPHCISWTDIDMGKTISTFLYYFLISFITSFFPKHCMQALRNSTFVWAPSASNSELCTKKFNAQIKCFVEKRSHE